MAAEGMDRVVDTLCLERAEGPTRRVWLRPGRAEAAGSGCVVMLRVERRILEPADVESAGEDWDFSIDVFRRRGKYNASPACQHLLRTHDGPLLMTPRALERRADGRPERMLVDLTECYPRPCAPQTPAA